MIVDYKIKNRQTRLVKSVTGKHVYATYNKLLWPMGNMKNLLIILLIFISSNAFSKGWTENISCGNAVIDISISEKEAGIKIWEVALKARSKFKKEYKSTLMYDQVYFSYACEKTKKGQDYFVYQAYCSGTGCSDKDNWGIIDNYGKLILVPYAGNRSWKESVLVNN